MDMTVTAKLRLDVQEDQMTILDATMDAYRRACNMVAGYVYRTRDLKQFSINEELYYRLRTDYGLRSQMAQSVIKTVLARYKAISANQGRWIRPDFRKPQYDLVYNRDYSLAGGLFSVNTLGGRVKLPYFEKGMEHYLDRSVWRFGTAKLVKRHGKYFLHVPVTRPVDELKPEEVRNVAGVDRGLRFLATAYDSNGDTMFLSGNEVKQARAKYKQLRRELQRRGTPSARRRLKALGRRENRWMRDVNHRASKALVEANPAGTLFVLEDLTGVRRAAERVKRRNRYEQVSWAYYDFEQKLKYKAAMAGDAVVNVDPAYTSQTCPKCGHVERANRDKRRHVFHCKNCGYESNDDRVAAMNLHRMGINYLEGSQVPDAVASG